MRQLNWTTQWVCEWHRIGIAILERRREPTGALEKVLTRKCLVTRNYGCNVDQH